MPLLKSILSSVPPVREFSYSPSDNSAASFYVTLRYVSPAEFESKRDEIAASVQSKAMSDERDQREAAVALVEKLFVDTVEPAIVGIRGMTLASLRTMVPMNADRVKQLGGPKAPFDPDREDIRELLRQCRPFSNWCAGKMQALSGFQDAAFQETLLGNSEPGPSTNTAPTPSIPPTSQ